MIIPTIARMMDMQASEINDMIDDIVKPPYNKIIFSSFTSSFPVLYSSQDKKIFSLLFNRFYEEKIKWKLHFTVHLSFFIRSDWQNIYLDL